MTANWVKTRSPNLAWTELKKELCMQYSVNLSDIHPTQAFSLFEQDLDELLDDYLHHASNLLSKIYHTSDMSSISVEGTNYYAVVYSLNCRKLKDSIAGYQSTQSRTIEECFRDICNVSAGCEQAKGYCRAKFNTLDASCITEIKTMKKTGPCYKCKGPHINTANSQNQLHR